MYDELYPKERTAPDSVAADQLRAFVDRIERLLDRKWTLSREIDSVYLEAWDKGFNVRILRTIVVRRARAGRDREESEATVIDMRSRGTRARAV
jgi:uncharacterized protein (UPF0335 family)